jgi:uncharacterized protein (UPF0303 family)
VKNKVESEQRDKILEILTEQEKALVFDKFDAEDAWKIGNKIREKIVAQDSFATIDISCGERCLFSCCTEGVTPHNLTWIKRKRNTVLEFWQSSYFVTLNLEKNGKSLESRGLQIVDYALSGGGFPIRLKNSGVIGAIVVSGMDQSIDHQVIVDAVSEYLGIEVPSLW